MTARRARIGSFTSEGGRGIITASVEPGTGALRELSVSEAVADPSFLVVDEASGLLYTVGEHADGRVAALRLAQDTVEPLAPPVPVDGDDPTYLALADGRVFTANYGSGSVSMLALDEAGAPVGPPAVLQFTGSGPNRERQEGPHAHWVQPDPSGRWLLSVDLGSDRVRVCRLVDGALSVHSEVELRPGSGPRHLAFHPRGGHAYLVNELAPTVTVLAWDDEAGKLTALGETDLLPVGAEDAADSLPSGIAVAPDGRHLYIAIRGHDSISVLSIDETGGELRLRASVPCGGDWPRAISLDPEGRHLYVANQRAGGVTWFTLDAATGLPAPAGSLPAPASSCVVFG
ncbi:lactonase family protein [Streptomyces polyrhachis]|uniref:Lactonase family protein n=1 Tax=Streptomyces polyrhachis TaxID=1282885 RepID=A0ABW2GC71_9ACTN